MSTEEQRLRNRRKQRRWRERHRDLIRERKRHKKLLAFEPDLRSFRGRFRTFELGDPRDAPNYVPRLIGYCRAGQKPLWNALWAVMAVSNTKWAAWFRELDAAGLEPVELSGWAVGIVMPINRRLARAIVAMRLEEESELASSSRNPPRLLNELRKGGKGRCRCVGRLLPDGTAERFTSLREASREVGMSLASLDHLASTGGMDSSGSRWFDA